MAAKHYDKSLEIGNQAIRVASGLIIESRVVIEFVNAHKMVRTIAMPSAQARELAAMLLQAANAADGLPARPAAIEDVPLQYVHLADNDESTPFRPLPSEMRLEDNGAYPVIRLVDDSVEDSGWLASDYTAGIDGGIEGESD